MISSFPSEADLYFFSEADLDPVPAAVAELGGAEEAGAGDGGRGLGPHNPLLQPPGGHLQVTLSAGPDKVSCEMKSIPCQLDFVLIDQNLCKRTRGYIII